MSATRAFFRSAAAALALGASFGAAQAQGYPAKPISLIVPFAAGGGVDATARLLTAKLGELLKQPVVIENVAGAAGTIGTQKVARAPADGYTLLFAVASPLNVAPLVAPSAVRYDTFKDFVPVATVGTSPFVLIGKTALPARTAAELIQLAKAQPGKLNFGTDGVGTSLHITAEMIKQRAGIDIVHVPYKSGPQVLTDVAGGQVDLAVLPLSLAQPFIKDGKVKAFGVTSLARCAQRAGDPGAGRDAGTQGPGDGFLARRAGPGRHAGRRDRGLGERARCHAQGPGGRAQARRHRGQAAADRRPGLRRLPGEGTQDHRAAWCRPPASRPSEARRPMLMSLTSAWIVLPAVLLAGGLIGASGIGGVLLVPVLTKLGGVPLPQAIAAASLGFALPALVALGAAAPRAGAGRALPAAAGRRARRRRRRRAAGALAAGRPR